jgi:hypothetical protein
MSIEIAAASALTQSSAAAGTTGSAMQAGYGVSLTDFGGFQQALANAGTRLEARPVTGPNDTVKALFQPFDHINSEAARITADGQAAQAQGSEITPGQMVMLTARCQEFMFHCQLMSTVANKGSEGLTQLFRQQS